MASLVCGIVQFIGSRPEVSNDGQEQTDRGGAQGAYPQVGEHAVAEPAVPGPDARGRGARHDALAEAKMAELTRSERLARKVKLVWRVVWRRAPLSSILLIYYLASLVPQDLLLVACGVTCLVENTLDTMKPKR